jgi:hypothetical protein
VGEGEVLRRLAIANDRLQNSAPTLQTSLMKQLLTALLLAPDAAFGALPPKATDYKGTVVEITQAAVTVQGKIGTRVFPIHPGTIFGRGGKQKLSDFKPGTHVTVVFSEITGIVKAENIRTSTPPAPKAPPSKKPKK